MTEGGKYIYCIINGGERRKFGPIGIGGRGAEVYTICCKDIGAVISDSLVAKYSICRENTLAHQEVLEAVMKDYTVLPVRFGTIAESAGNGVNPEELIKQKVLEARYEEFKNLLEKMDNKIELGLKAVWKDINSIFREIVEDNKAIKTLKEGIIGSPFIGTREAQRAKIGEMVKDALDAKREKEGKAICDALKELSVDFRMNKTFGDKMLLNAAFLVDRSKEAEFDNEVNKLAAKYDDRMKFNYVGPVPAYNFVEIIVTWD